MAKYKRITLVPKRTPASADINSLRRQVTEAEKEEKEKVKRVYKPKVRLTAHIKR